VTSPTELVIFDCDGVLVDSDRLSLEIQARHLTDLGIPMSAEDCSRGFLRIGMESTLETITGMLGRPVPEGWLDALEAEVAEAFRRELQAVPGVVDALDQIDIPTCIASGGSHEKMRLTLGLTGLLDRFDGRIYSAREVQSPKPAPDLFLHAAAESGVDPTRCLVVEDSPFGVAAAKAAGMRCFGFAALTGADRLVDSDAIFSSMAELPGLITS
jgi:HAD superfamily hydrolase (TIGR01509 family)